MTPLTNYVHSPPPPKILGLPLNLTPPPPKKIFFCSDPPQLFWSEIFSFPLKLGRGGGGGVRLLPWLFPLNHLHSVKSLFGYIFTVCRNFLNIFVVGEENSMVGKDYYQKSKMIECRGKQTSEQPPEVFY